ncbi:MAG: hypothetical protein ACREHD_29685 [Pirellulales bacterium]
MSGTVVISEHADWLPSGWVYDNALEAISNELRRSDAPLADRCLEARTSVSQGYLDLKSLDDESYRRFLSAADQALATVRSALPADGHGEFYTAYFDQFEKLLKLLWADPRATIRGAVAGARNA